MNVSLCPRHLILNVKKYSNQSTTTNYSNPLNYRLISSKTTVLSGIVTTASQHAAPTNNNNNNNNYSNHNGSIMDHRKARESMSEPGRRTIRRETDSMLFDTVKSEADVVDV